MRRTTAALTLLLSCCRPARPSMARPPHKKALADYLGPLLAQRLNDCRTCHVPAQDGDDDLEDKPHNPFGARLKRVKAELQTGRQADRHPRAPGGRGGRGQRRRWGAEPRRAARRPRPGRGGRHAHPGRGDPRAAGPGRVPAAEGLLRLGALRAGAGGRPSRRVQATAWVRNPIDAFIAAEHEARGLTPRPEAAAAGAAAARLPRPDRPAADARGAARVPGRRRRRTPTRRSSIGCWPARATASAGAGTGWTSGATATGPAGASRSATASRTSGAGATGSSSRSTPTRATTGWSSRCSPPTRSPPTTRPPCAPPASSSATTSCSAARSGCRTRSSTPRRRSSA